MGSTGLLVRRICTLGKPACASIGGPMPFSPLCLPPATAGGRRQRHLWHQGCAGALLLPQVNGGRAAAAPPHQARATGVLGSIGDGWSEWRISSPAGGAKPPFKPEQRIVSCCQQYTWICPTARLSAARRSSMPPCRMSRPRAAASCCPLLWCAAWLITLLLLLCVALAAAKVALLGPWVQLLCCECTSGHPCTVWFPWAFCGP